MFRFSAREPGQSGLFAAPPGEPECVLHASDQDCDEIVALSELLLGIQCQDFGGYTSCPGRGFEAGFCA